MFTGKFKNTFIYISNNSWAGISRSSSCIAAYLMLEYGMSLTNALALIKRGRNKINPNPGFRKQLQEFERKLKGLRQEGKVPQPADASSLDR